MLTESWSGLRWGVAACFAVLLLVPVIKGDLAGYDDALYAHIAKGAYESGDWLHLKSNGYPALEHPPLLPWIEAAFFTVFGLSDAVARLPSALCGFGVILLVWWLARRLLQDETAALLAMFVMGTSLYFLKYAARAMTDVPFAFLFLAAICAWKLAEAQPRWLLVAGLFTSAAQMTRGMMGFALPLLFALDLVFARRFPHRLYTAAALVIAFAPSALWYWFLYANYGDFFLTVHREFLGKEIVQPSIWKPFVFAWMLAKSYWPWLPATIAGVWLFSNSLYRNRLVILWIVSVFAACAAVKNPVLRYLLPAYPAFAIAAGAGLVRVTPAWAVRYAVPAIAAAAAVVAAFLPPHRQATETRLIAIAATKRTQPSERVAFYDSGASRFDESNQLQWYGDRSLYILERPEDLDRNLRNRLSRVFVIDRATRDAKLPDSTILAEAGHLVCVRRHD